MVSASSTLTRPAFAPTVRATTVRPLPHPRAGFFARIVEAIAASNRRRAEREIARWLELRGGKLTDSLERQMERRFMRGEPDGNSR